MLVFHFHRKLYPLPSPSYINRLPLPPVLLIRYQLSLLLLSRCGAPLRRSSQRPQANRAFLRQRTLADHILESLREHNRGPRGNPIHLGVDHHRRDGRNLLAWQRGGWSRSRGARATGGNGGGWNDRQRDRGGDDGSTGSNLSHGRSRGLCTRIQVRDEIGWGRGGGRTQ